MKVLVTGLGLVSALGTTLDSWHRLLAGDTGIRIAQPFSELSYCPLGLVANQPGDLETLTQQAVAAALQDAGLGLPLPECGVVVGSSRGHQARWEQAQGRCTSFGVDEHWLSTLPGMIAIATARQIGTTGPVLSPMAACATGIWAIAQGFELLETGQCQQVIVGAAEAPVTPLTLAGFKQIGALAERGAYPFDCRRDGLVLGEAAAIFVLETVASARGRRANVYGQVLGFGLSADGYHVTAPDPQRTAAIAAVQQCLNRSSLSVRSIGYIHAHGTGTRLNDQAEADLIQKLFPGGVPVSSTKGATGHTLGASGALGVAFCLMALKDQILPPCVGLQQPAFALDLIAAARSAQVRAALCFSFGFGGQNAVLAIGAG